VRAIEAYEAVRFPTGKVHLCPSGHFREGCFITSVPIQKFLPAFCVCLKGAPAEPFN